MGVPTINFVAHPNWMMLGTGGEPWFPSTDVVVEGSSGDWSAAMEEVATGAAVLGGCRSPSAGGRGHLGLQTFHDLPVHLNQGLQNHCPVIESELGFLGYPICDRYELFLEFMRQGVAFFQKITAKGTPYFIVPEQRFVAFLKAPLPGFRPAAARP